MKKVKPLRTIIHCANKKLGGVSGMTRIQGDKQNKFNAKRCWSELCQRFFDSKLERERGEQLYWMEKEGVIKELNYQVPFVLCDIPNHKVKIVIDFAYLIPHNKQLDFIVYEDAKGVLTRDTRTKLAWLKEKYGIDVVLYSG